MEEACHHEKTKYDKEKVERQVEEQETPDKSTKYV